MRMRPTPQPCDPGVIWTGSTYIDLRDPDPARIRLDDIALVLSRLPRFGGAAKAEAGSYSVLDHSVFCHNIALTAGAGADLRCAVLMHDAHEYLTGDMPTPVKRILPDYRAFESRCADAVAKRFGLSGRHHRAVKAIDAAALDTEKRLFLAAPDDWPGGGPGVDLVPCMPGSHQQRRRFLRLCENLAIG